MQCTAEGPDGNPGCSAFYNASGLFDSACARGGIPESFADMFTVGERFRYPMALVAKNDFVNGPRFTLIYDIGCKLTKRIEQKYGDTVNVRLAVGIFHSYRHDLDCQMSISPRYLGGFSFTDGEWIFVLDTNIGRWLVFLCMLASLVHIRYGHLYNYCDTAL
ncbi:hypothetical protein BCR42DRAFT_75833 [Absidia repens]|uniref:Uncharacterized protein n=1 Tax=Absidia repens TaxID=90262 RepID=A0A1X2IAA9_9FUNG|nr:hypothetical protein BCR42DRAFT_75833 [Absidia repens]